MKNIDYLWQSVRVCHMYLIMTLNLDRSICRDYIDATSSFISPSLIRNHYHVTPSTVEGAHKTQDELFKKEMAVLLSPKASWVSDLLADNVSLLSIKRTCFIGHYPSPLMRLIRRGETWKGCRRRLSDRPSRVTRGRDDSDGDICT